MIIIAIFLPTVLAKTKLKTSVPYVEHDYGRGHEISLSGKRPRNFEMSYSVSQNARRDAAYFFVDGTRFDYKSPPSDLVRWERDETVSPTDTTACNEVAQINADRNIHVSFTGDHSSTAQASTQLCTGTSRCSNDNSVSYILLNALICGLGIILIFFCSWLLLRSYFTNTSAYLRPSRSKRRRSRTSSSSTTNQVSKESKESIPEVIRRSRTQTPVPSIKSEVSSSQSARSASPAPVEWTPHMDVSKVAPNGFVDTPAVLLPPERNLTPPPPPPMTIKGYNRVLDEPRPAKIEKILQVYDFIFLIDDSSSMIGPSWTEARESVNQLANWILDNGWDRDGITLRFLNSNYLFQFKDLNGIHDKDKIRQLVNTVNPTGCTPTGQRCKEILDAHIDKLERTKHTPEYATNKPLILVVITDGQPTDGQSFDLSNVLTSASKRLANTHHHPNSMAIQFVQVGRNQGAMQTLKQLTLLNTNGMVDAITSNDLGALSPDKLGQLMLGGVHPNVRAKGA